LDQTSDLTRRKDQHLDVVLSGAGAGSGSTGFEAVRFAHVALPELDFDAVDLTTTFLGRRLNAPILISSMTGGPSRAEAINARLAEAAQELRIAVAVGSQRVAIESDGVAGLDLAVRRRAPDVPLLANIGAAQLNLGWGVDQARRAVEMIGADALIVHLNPLQEAVQPEGDRNWAGLERRLGDLVRTLGAPVIVKETGAGIGGLVARRLFDLGVAAVDVAGAGGTNWALVEGGRLEDEPTRRLAAAFADWGVPTALAIRQAREAAPEGLIIGSGGVRDGVDAAKAIRLGADLVAQAAGVLQAALISTEAVVGHFELVLRQLRTACFCTASADLAALRKAPLLV
jgi:isopentenyl-diphosphate delta-isomerase